MSPFAFCAFQRIYVSIVCVFPFFFHTVSVSVTFTFSLCLTMLLPSTPTHTSTSLAPSYLFPFLNTVRHQPFFFVARIGDFKFFR